MDKAKTILWHNTQPFEMVHAIPEGFIGASPDAFLDHETMLYIFENERLRVEMQVRHSARVLGGSRADKPEFAIIGYIPANNGTVFVDGHNDEEAFCYPLPELKRAPCEEMALGLMRFYAWQYAEGDKPPVQVYKIQVVWQMSGTMRIAAHSLAEAEVQARGPQPLPTESYYLEDSIELDVGNDSYGEIVVKGSD